MQSVVIKAVEVSAMASILEHSTVGQSLDIGSTVITSVTHPEFGPLTLVNSAMDEQGAIIISPEFADRIAN